MRSGYFGQQNTIILAHLLYRSLEIRISYAVSKKIGVSLLGLYRAYSISLLKPSQHNYIKVSA
jgi:hypothetical protein